MTITHRTTGEESAIGMTVEAFEQLRARAHARAGATGGLGQGEFDVAVLIDDRDALLEKLALEVGTVNVLVSWLRQAADEPDLPFSLLPDDVAVSEYAAPGPEVLSAEKFLDIVHRHRDPGAGARPHARGDRTALVFARAPLAAQLLHAQARAEALSEWLARLLNAELPQTSQDA